MVQLDIRYCLFFFSFYAAFSCSEKRQEPPVTTIAVSGVQVDSIRRENIKASYDSSIVLGFRFGMTKQEYDYTYSRLIRADTLHQFSKTEYSYLIKSPLSKFSVDAVLTPTFDKGELIQLKMLTYEMERGTGTVIIQDYLSKQFGLRYLSKRSLSDIWIKGGLEVEVKREQVQTDPNYKATPHNIITFRPTQLALLAHL
ncbi:hypothetical protein GCM10027592_29620 [Spirosoma flavus]